jgi:xanthine/uracil permease
MAHVIGAVPAVVLGGIGTLAVAVIWALGFPQLRNIDSLEAPKQKA